VLAAALATMLALPAYRKLGAASLATRDLATSLVAQVDGVGYLVRGPLLTLRTNIDPDIALSAFAVEWWALATALAVAIVVAGCAVWRVPTRAAAQGDWQALAGVACGWFLVQLAPTNSLLARFDLANDRQLYLALIAPAVVVVVLAGRLPARAATAVVAVLVATFAGATLIRNLDYQSEVALWEATARASPAKARVHHNLGYALALAGDREGARSAYRRALELDPAFARAELNLRDVEAAGRAAPVR
jgi:tetratricopeptide (TPR) repeat protein